MIKYVVEGEDYGPFYIDINECVKDYLDSMMAEDWPKTLTLDPYEPVTPVFYEWMFSLEDILESLDNEFAERYDTKPTVAMIEAAEHFKQVVLSEYSPEKPAMELNENKQPIRVNVFDWVHNNNFCGSEEIEAHLEEQRQSRIAAVDRIWMV